MIALTAVVGTTVFFASCQKEKDETPANPTQEQPATEGKYKKVITLMDEQRENWMKLLVSADNEDLLAKAEEIFTLKALTGGEVFPSEPSKSDPPAQTTPFVGDPSNMINFEVIDQHMASGIESLALGVQSPQGVQSRNTGYTVSGASNCGFGWKVYSNSGTVKFDVNRYVNQGANCPYPNTLNGSYCQARYVSTGYFWGARYRVIVNCGSGTYWLQQCQCPFQVIY